MTLAGKPVSLIRTSPMANSSLARSNQESANSAIVGLADTSPALATSAFAHRSAGRFSEAITRYRQILRRCCSGRCSPPVRSTCARSMAGRRLQQSRSISQLTSLPERVFSKCCRSRHTKFQHKSRRHPYDSLIYSIDWVEYLPEGLGQTLMSHPKQASKRKRRRKAVPMLGAAGLSLSLASGATAAIGGLPADMPTRNTGASHAITLGEEEISDVSLATFYVFGKETAGTFRPGVRLASGCAGGGCAGCGGCGCWSGTNYTAPVFGSNDPQHHPIKPAHKYTHAPERKRVPKNP